MSKILILIIFLSFNKITSQEIIGIDDTYIENNLVYKISNDSLFNGIAQRKRRNGHLVFETKFKKGIIISSKIYYNGKIKRVSNKTIYNSEKPYLKSKEYKYNLESEIFETTTYNENGEKILLEQFKKGKLTYSCEYLGKKKHGIELGYEENGEKLTYSCEYKNGKKHGEELCIKCGDKKRVTKYENGKKIK
ncbi:MULTISPECIES: toxin-antitoxin system YwqK family antitoxin [Tenacibaculum]|uniref:hypothetical protein n=1 Tax=Tenacibaculum TaxID=104267 RepID=UPI001F0A211C|nr:MULTISPECIES: hypothetical protein [Tenacibaculum]MCH3882995.1 hypothetical protein [Tenacibaculum aquimarinum]MDO6601046.1 hypothetical protein [Tenacibaculum sp. 1_MG-2023]